jgi:hypothetical protein
MDINHTPGPWSVWNYGESAIDLAVGPQIGGIAVAQIVTAQANGIATPDSMGTGNANAKLIASAPELLKALVTLLADYESAKSQAHNLGIQWLGSSQAPDWQAHQVIAKATA